MFINWSPLFGTDIPEVDKEHKALFDMLNDMTNKLNQGLQSEDSLNAALDQLLNYAERHFSHEIDMMVENGVLEKHVKMQRMEHSAFIYDAKNMYANPTDHTLNQRFERLIHFVTSWLVFHTLMTDQLMAKQVFSIQNGMSPDAAFERAVSDTPDPALTRFVLEAVIHLWTEQTARCHALESELAQLHSEAAAS